MVKGYLAAVEHLQLFGYDLDVARGDVGVLAGALGNGAGHLYHPLAAEFIGGLAERSVSVALKHYLCDAVAVADVDKGHSAHFACSLHPTGQRYFAAGVANAEFTACICPVHRFFGYNVQNYKELAKP